MTTTYSAPLGIVAPEAGWTPPIRYLLRRARILSWMARQQRGPVLEIGCGAGALLCDFTRLGFRAEGLETSAEAVRLGRRLAQLAVSDHTIRSEPAAGWEGAFDFVCAFDVLEHIEKEDDAVASWLRWLSPRGQLLISVPAHQHRWGAGDEWAGHWRRYSRDQISAMAVTHGMRILHLECYGFPVANLTEWAGNRVYRKMMRERGVVAKESATASSGVDRRAYNTMAVVLKSWPSRALLQMANAAQSVTRNRDWGSGYLMVATRA
jgi:SAM-dependent methyltransferase